MKWWTKGIIASVGVVVLWLAVGIVVTDVVLKDKITPEQDFKISESVGQTICISVTMVWAIAYSLHRKVLKKTSG